MAARRAALRVNVDLRRGDGIHDLGHLLQLLEFLLELLEVRGIRLHHDHFDLGRLVRDRARDQLEQREDNKNVDDDRTGGPPDMVDQASRTCQSNS